MTLFGASESGKSTVLFDILYLLKPHVPLIFVFSPTAEENKAFDGIVPPQCIFTEIDIEKIKLIYERQKAATRIFNTVNNVKNLQKTFATIASPKSMASAKLAYCNAVKIIARKNNDQSLNASEKKITTSLITGVRDEYLIKLYKNEIRNSILRLNKMRLTSLDKYIIKYLDFIPYCILIFDDCGAVISKFTKDPVLKKIGYQGRHNMLQAIYTLQDDTDMTPTMKKQSKINIFTTDQCASAYFQRKTNNFTKKTKTTADKIISHVFADTGNKRVTNHKKLIYLRGESDPFRYTIADVHEPFKFGCSALWGLSESLQGKKDTLSFEDDPLMSSFNINL
jgi:hypothetical protein